MVFGRSYPLATRICRAGAKQVASPEPFTLVTLLKSASNLSCLTLETIRDYSEERTKLARIALEKPQKWKSSIRLLDIGYFDIRHFLLCGLFVSVAQLLSPGQDPFGQLDPPIDPPRRHPVERPCARILSKRNPPFAVATASQTADCLGQSLPMRRPGENDPAIPSRRDEVGRRSHRARTNNGEPRPQRLIHDHPPAIVQRWKHKRYPPSRRRLRQPINGLKTGKDHPALVLRRYTRSDESLPKRAFSDQNQLQFRMGVGDGQERPPADSRPLCGSINWPQYRRRIALDGDCRG